MLSSPNSKIDFGRLIVVPLFSMIMVVNMMSIGGDIQALRSATVIAGVRLVHRILILCFYSLVVFLYFLRSAAKSTTQSWSAKTAATVASFLPFMLPLSMAKPSDDPWMLIGADVITLSGLAAAIYSLTALGKSFSIIPQARSLVQTGPYRFVRHPLYAAELVSMFGIVLAGRSIPGVAVFCLLVSLQIYRALEEERVLAGIFPEYESFFVKKARFIPGIF